MCFCPTHLAFSLSICWITLSKFLWCRCRAVIIVAVDKNDCRGVCWYKSVHQIQLPWSMLLATLLGMVVIVLAMMPVVDLFIVGGRSFFRSTYTNKQPSKWMDCVTVLPSVTLKLAALIVASRGVPLEMSQLLLMVELRLFLLQNCPAFIPSHDRTNTACPNTTDPPPPMPFPH